MDSSLSSPAISSVKKTTPETIAGSGSFESHLSLLHTQHRVRPGLQHIPPDPRKTPLPGPHPPSRSYAFHLASFVRNFLSEPILPLPAEAGHPRPRVCRNSIKGMLYLYYFVGCVFFSASLYRSLFVRAHVPAALLSPAPTTRLSYLDAITSAARLAKLSAIHPPARDFQPFLLRPHVDSAATAACLWASDGDLDWLVHWTTRWEGPISLLITTRKPRRPTRSPLPRKVSGFLQSPSLNTSLVSLHMLYLDPAASDSPNAFLNLARLFSPTQSVLLVPADTPPPAPLSITSHSKLPTLLTNGSRTASTYPFAPLSPVLLRRDYPIWCTERFFAAAQTRATDWDECLWQLHLETYGRMAALPLPPWPGAEENTETAAPTSSSSLTTSIRRRLSSRYKSERCVLAMKRLEAFAVEERGRTRRVDADKVRWLASVCKEWTSGSSA